MAKFTTTQRQLSGIALGGIGAGSVELRPDGEFHEWQIANVEKFRQACGARPNVDNGEKLAGSLSFYVRTRTETGEILLRRLGLGLGSGQDREEYNYRMHSFNKPVEAIDYEGTFPTAQLCYQDRALPLDISLRAASPFLPRQEQTAGTPGLYLTFTVKNTSNGRVEVALAGKLRNIVNESLQGNGRKNRLLQEPGRVTVLMESDGSVAAETPDCGSLALSLAGEDISWISGEYRGYMNEYVSHGFYGISEESFLFGLRGHGRLPSLSVKERPAWRILPEETKEADQPRIDELLERLLQFSFARSLKERLEYVQPDLLQTEESRREFCKYLLRNLNDLDRETAWGDAALCESMVLEPGQEREVRFVLSWYFPSLYSAAGNRVGHVYENWFGDAAQVNAFLWERREEILQGVYELTRNLYDASYPEAFSDAVSVQLSTLVKCSWWAKSGDFGVWEGLGSCGFHTTDITYHGSFGLVNLFPALQKRQMLMGATFQREDGRVHHFFTPDFLSVDDGFDRVDMNPQFVLMVCRDYLATGDEEYVRKLWPHVEKAMASTERLDQNGDGLPDQDTGRNTYDAWHFSGTSTYISVLWLAALRAAVRLAVVVGESELAQHWSALEKKGVAAVESLLWNGDYYNLWIDGKLKDECCMTDQLDGEYFSRLIGLGGILDENRVNAALEAIWSTNYTSENGLVNAGYPANKTATMYTWKNCQGEANWSGIEYAMAAFYLLQGSYEKGLRIVETVDERYRRAGEVWNHAECGDHYYRPLSSWALMQALSGVSVNLAERKLYIGSGALESDFYGPWFCPEGFGQVRREQKKWTLECRSGKLALCKIEVRGEGEILSLRVNGKTLSFERQKNEGITVVYVNLPVLQSGDCLEIFIA